MPTECFDKAVFEVLPHKPVVAEFDGGNMTSDAGLLLLAKVDQKVGLLDRLAACLEDRRDPRRIDFTHDELLRQRVFGLAAGYEDANDHDTLRSDPMLKVCAGRGPDFDEDLASQPTFCRFENAITPRDLVRMGHAFVDFFVDLHSASRSPRRQPPGRIILDFDDTDDPTHGQQEFTFFNAYHNTHCYIPLLVFASCDSGPQEPLVALLRSGKAHATTNTPAVLRQLIKRLQRGLPRTALLFRGDGNFGNPKIYDLLEAKQVEYVIGLPRNNVLEREAQPFIARAWEEFLALGATTQVFGEFRYRAGSWSHLRRVIVKAEILPGHPDKPNIRFVVTNNMDDTPQALYHFYTDRGDVESRIDELKNDCFSGRTSCHRFLANQFRLFMALAAYWLFVLLRQVLGIQEWIVAQVETLRVRLIKVAARVRESVRRVKFSLPSSFPWQDVWLRAVAALEGGM